MRCTECESIKVKPESNTWWYDAVSKGVDKDEIMSEKIYSPNWCPKQPKFNRVIGWMGSEKTPSVTTHIKLVEIEHIRQEIELKWAGLDPIVKEIVITEDRIDYCYSRLETIEEYEKRENEVLLKIEKLKQEIYMG